MVELKCVHNPNGKVSWGPGNYIVREIVRHQKTYEWNQMLLSVKKVGFIRLSSYLCTSIPKEG